jgi:hypothetical protein
MGLLYPCGRVPDFYVPLKVDKACDDNKVLDEANRALVEENKRLLRRLEKERQRRSEMKQSAATTSAKVKCSSLRAVASSNKGDACMVLRLLLFPGFFLLLLQNKRKSSSLKDGSSVGRAIDFSPAGADSSSRHPLSPLPQNSPDYRAHKK